ncbi:MAG: bifunctional nuclease family protein [Spirochaetota bacterium]
MKNIFYLSFLLVLLPVLCAFEEGCSKKPASFEGMPLTRVEVKEVALDPEAKQPVIILQDLDGTISLPIWIGSSEALSIASSMRDLEYPRPMTHDLMKNILDEIHVKVKKVVVTELREQTFYAVLLLTYRGKEQAVDSRPSDAIALAVRVDAPIYVADKLLQSRGIRSEREKKSLSI